MNRYSIVSSRTLYPEKNFFPAIQKTLASNRNHLLCYFFAAREQHEAPTASSDGVVGVDMGAEASGALQSIRIMLSYIPARKKVAEKVVVISSYYLLNG